MMTIPFIYDDYAVGLMKVSGFLKFNQDSISLEYYLGDNVLKVYKSDAKELTVPYNLIESIEYKKKFFKTKIIISLNSMKGIGSVPMLEENQLVFLIEKRNRENAKEFQVECNLLVSEYKLDLLE